jgi:hypothetical protein
MGFLMHGFWASLRRPLPPRADDATGVTIVTGLAALGAVALAPSSDLRARLALGGIGIVLLVIGFARPRFAWRFDDGWQGVLGDRLYAGLWVVAGIGIV